ncbi:MAG TPA: murein transglycosylase [Aliiroseovarius sp.]|nr:murein transglycosylase [Aliiroseovarius sp.]
MLGACPAVAGLADSDITLLSFDQLVGWQDDDQDEALKVFLDTCIDLNDPEWRPICNLAKTQDHGRTFFELFFVPVLIEDGNTPLFTAYFEPVLNGARQRGGRFQYPVYAKPRDLPSGTPWYTRREIEEQGVLAGRGLEIAWVDDPVALQFLQIQGSGRIRLQDGSTIRLGYAGSNGHRYRSLGDELVRQGIYNRHQVSAAVIGNWVRRNPQDGAKLLLHNPSFVFFREIGRVPPGRGPLGAMNRSITAERSLAVDPAYVPLGSPVWLEKIGVESFNRLMIAQDTGSRIKGAQRADIFYGTGPEAGRRAAQVHDTGRMVVLLPIQRAYALKPEG